MIYNRVQKEIAGKIEEKSELTNWRDWKWQLKHAIRSLDKFEYLTGIKFKDSERLFISSIRSRCYPIRSPSSCTR